MTGSHDTEFDRAVRIWEETGSLPRALDEGSRELRRLLLALDLEQSRPSETEIETALRRLSLGARPSLLAAADRVRGGWEEVRAILRVDLMRANPAFRSGASAAPVVFETPRFAITISVGVETIRGSVHPRQSAALPAGGRAVLLLGAERHETDLDLHGGFLFDEMEIDAGELEIEIDGQRIHLGILPDPSV